MKAVDKWLAGYLLSVLRRPQHVGGPRHLMFCLADHFEPFRGGASRETALRLANGWRVEYPKAVHGLADGDGKPPRHTFFYPQEEYDPECIDAVGSLCAGGCGEVEIHLHHRNDIAEGLRRKLIEFRDRLYEQHGLLGTDARGNARYGFIHGNWALCNSRPDSDWCGVNEELGILRNTGCYADFTFPSAPSPTQPRIVNAIYYARDIPGAPRGHDSGVAVATPEFRVQPPSLRLRRPRNSGFRGRINATQSAIPQSGTSPQPAPPERGPQSAIDQLMLIPGPLGLDWRQRKWGVLPRLENGAVTEANPPSPGRIDLWVKQHIHVRGRPQWVFVKVYTHGCVQENMNVFLDRFQGRGAERGKEMTMRQAHHYLQSKYNDGKEWILHYVTAREMYNIIRAAEDGKKGNPGSFRDYEISAPSCRGGL